MRWAAYFRSNNEPDAYITFTGRRYELRICEGRHQWIRGFYSTLAGAKESYWRYAGRGFQWRLVDEEPIR